MAADLTDPRLDIPSLAASRASMNVRALVADALNNAAEYEHSRATVLHLVEALRAVAPDLARGIEHDAEIDVDVALADEEENGAAPGVVAVIDASLVDVLSDAAAHAAGRLITLKDLIGALRRSLIPDDAPEGEDDDDSSAEESEAGEPTESETLAELVPAEPAPGARRRTPPSPADLIGAVVALLVADENARLLGRTTNLATLAFDADGRIVRVSVAPLAVTIDADIMDTRVYDEVHGVWYEDENINDGVRALAMDIAQRVQGLTGWHEVASDDTGFDPRGPCPGCGLEVFAWETACTACGADLDVDEDEGNSAGSDDDVDGPAMRRLGTLAAPTPAEASIWHRATLTPEVAALLAMVRAVAPKAVVQSATDAAAAVSIPVPGAGAVRVSIHRDALVFDWMTPSEPAEEGDPDEMDTPPAVDDTAMHLIEALQLRTRWYLTSDVYEGFEPCGACPGCRVEVFAWQEACAGCGASIPENWVSRSMLVAQSLVGALLDEGLLELSGERAEVESAVGQLTASGRATATSLLDCLADHEDVDEIFADEIALERILATAASQADAVLRAR